MAGTDSTKSIMYALFANGGVAILKSIAAFITGSGAMLAEAIHSFADCSNQGLLLWGMKQSKKLPSPNYPMGYGKAIYFWSFIVALILFSLGGLFSINEGIHKLETLEPVTNPIIAIVVLSLSILFEFGALFGCLKQIKEIRGDKPLSHWIKNSRQSELLVILGEDAAAMLGLTFALIAVVLTMITGNPVWDAIGSISIGVLLVGVSIFIGVKIKGLLIGQSVSPDLRAEMKKFIGEAEGVTELLNLITLHLGDDIMVAVKAKMSNSQTGEAMVKDINAAEKAIKQKFPQVRWVFFEPDIVA